MPDIQIGNNYGSLHVISIIKGAKNLHPKAICRCECGNERTVRQTDIRRGLVISCSTCSAKRAWKKRARMPRAEAETSKRYGWYKNNANRRNLEFSLTKKQFNKIILSNCHYCGTEKAKGADRFNNAIGYTKENSVPCCSSCNYAKRDMDETVFLEWIKRVFMHRFGQ